MAAVDAYQSRSRQSVFVEYVMLGPDVNCTPQHAHQLGALLRGRDVLVNLIPWWAAAAAPLPLALLRTARCLVPCLLLRGLPLQASPEAASGADPYV